MNPVSWWHDLQGGKIAEERPPPPGADQPYPNLATVPPKPAAAGPRARSPISRSALIADRTNAQHCGAAAPLADPSSPSASPALFGRGPCRRRHRRRHPAPRRRAPRCRRGGATPPRHPRRPAKGRPRLRPRRAAPARAPVACGRRARHSRRRAPQRQPAAEAGPPPQMSAMPPPPANLGGAPSAPSRPVTAAPPAPASEPGSPQAVNSQAANPPAADPTSTVSVAFTNGSAALSATAD